MVINRIKTPITVAIVVVVGVIVLAGYFFNFPVLVNMRQVILQWAVILGAIALLVGVANLLSVHFRKISGGHANSFYSLIMVLAFIATLIVAGLMGPTSTWSLWIFNYIQIPVEGSLMGLLAIILVYAAIRMLVRRQDAFTIIFLLTLLIFLLGTVTVTFFQVPGVAEFRAWLERVPVTAGTRGILLGVALGTIATALRILMGTDRPYGG